MAKARGLRSHFGQHGVECMLRLINGAMERIEEPGKPLGDVQRPFLGPLQDVVVGLAFALDLRRQTVEPLWTAIGTGQEQITDGPGDTAIAIVERVQSDKPQRAEACFEQQWFV